MLSRPTFIDCRGEGCVELCLHSPYALTACLGTIYFYVVYYSTSTLPELRQHTAECQINNSRINQYATLQDSQ